MSQQSNASRGFSLIELIILIALIGILFMAVAIYLTGAQKSSRDSIRKSDIHTYYLALSHYYQDHHTYPDQKSTQGDNSTNPKSSSVFDSSGANPLSGTTDQQAYLATVPKDPSNGEVSCQVGRGTAYSVCQYNYLANKTDAVVWTTLENPTAQGGVYFASSDGVTGYANGTCTGPKVSPCQ